MNTVELTEFQLNELKNLMVSIFSMLDPDTFHDLSLSELIHNSIINNYKKDIKTNLKKLNLDKYFKIKYTKMKGGWKDFVRVTCHFNEKYISDIDNIIILLKLQRLTK